MQKGENSEPTQKKKKQQCRLCANHDLHVVMKGHKHFCPYMNCQCEYCKITKMRQHYMKKQQQITRRQQQQQLQQQQYGIVPQSSFSSFGPPSMDTTNREFPPSRRQEMERDLACIDDETLLEKINELCKTKGKKN